jgi:hypothetical protein
LPRHPQPDAWLGCPLAAPHQPPRHQTSAACRHMRSVGAQHQARQLQIPCWVSPSVLDISCSLAHQSWCERVVKVISAVASHSPCAPRPCDRTCRQVARRSRLHHQCAARACSPCRCHKILPRMNVSRGPGQHAAGEGAACMLVSQCRQALTSGPHMRPRRHPPRCW